MPPRIGKFRRWPDGLRSGRDVVEMYNQGYAGVGVEPEIDEQLDASLELASFSATGLHGTGKGKLSLPYLDALKHNPQQWPGPAQRTGCCVSRGTVNACIVTIYVEVERGTADPETGEVEGPPPDVPDPSQQQFDHAIIYGTRGHRQQGTSCVRIAKAVSDFGGLLPRGRHQIDGYGVYDCTKYNDTVAHNFGPMTPEPLLRYAREHAYIRQVTRIRSTDEARDALANGYGINACSGYGFQGERNEHGVTRRRGSWSHAMAWIACDDRDWAHQTYGGPLFLIQNSWGKYNSGPRRIYGTQHDIPHGSFWVVQSDAARIIDSGGSFAFSSARGFPARKLPDYGFTGVI